MHTFTFYRITVAVALLASACLAASAEVIVVVSAKSPATALTQEQAADIFLGRSSTLPGAGTAVPIDQAEGATVREEFYQKTAGKSGAQLKAYWSKQIFSGKGQPPKTVGDSAAVKAQLATNPNLTTSQQPRWRAIEAGAPRPPSTTKVIMNIKSRIWSLPVISIVIFGIGIAVSSCFANTAQATIERTGKVDYAMLSQSQILRTDVQALADDLKNAVMEGDKKRLDSVDDNVARLDAKFALFSALPGHQDTGARLAKEFKAYAVQGKRTARVMLEIDSGDTAVEIAGMQRTFKWSVRCSR